MLQVSAPCLLHAETGDMLGLLGSSSTQLPPTLMTKMLSLAEMETSQLDIKCLIVALVVINPGTSRQGLINSQVTSGF